MLENESLEFRRGRGVYTQEQQRALLAEVDVARRGGATVPEGCAKAGIDVRQYGNWSQKFKKKDEKEKSTVGREIVHVTGEKDKRIKLLEIENQRLKTIVADLTLDKHALIEYGSRA